jgi:hypothetical protein
MRDGMGEPGAESSEVVAAAVGSVSAMILTWGADSGIGSLRRRLMRGLSTPEAALVAAGV